ncbi:helix-turn-helix transcriptional regulator [Olivibacter sp. CPCC 100613]|uniref:helix-turn-helix domain-containing protein n=1 Tax=Olivibacter sp. CPCC 100613 TaxID=3079931 RepID=UPI002FFA7081
MAKINRLDEILDETKVSNRKIAKLVNKSEATISRWRNNHRQPPLEDLEEISKFLRIDRRQFLHESEWSDDNENKKTE